MAEFFVGSGDDGALSITSSRTEDTTRGVSNINSGASSGQANVTVASATSFSAGDWVLLIQMTGTGRGQYEFAKVLSKASNTLTMEGNLTYTYQSSGAQCIKVGQYSSVTVGTGGTWTASAWNGTVGGVLVAMVTGNVVVDSGRTITADGLGHNGGAGAQFDFGGTGSGDGGGAGGDGRFSCSQGGGGGGYGVAGSAGSMSGCGGGAGGSGGGTYGQANLQVAHLGSGGGGGAKAGVGGTNGGGGKGAGIIILVVGGNITVSGNIYCRGLQGTDGTDGADGGGGSGGSIRFICEGTITMGSNLVNASGGGGVGNGGGGGAGRVAGLSTSTISGTSTPTIDVSSTDTTTTADPFIPFVPTKGNFIAFI